MQRRGKPLTVTYPEGVQPGETDRFSHQKSGYSPYLYASYEVLRSWQKVWLSGWNTALVWAGVGNELAAAMGAPRAAVEYQRAVLAANREFCELMSKDYEKPEFHLDQTTVDGKPVKVLQEVVTSTPFCRLLHFQRLCDRKDPKVLIVAPLSGHYATLLRDTVAGLLPVHDVYITDWQNARDVPLQAGDFGVDHYVTHVKEFIEAVGPQSSVLAVCQPTVPVLAAVSLLAQQDSPYAPVGMVLMGGPIDTEAATSQVTDLAEDNDIEFFEKNLIGVVPSCYRGAGRKVFPGFVALGSFVAMNPVRHASSYFDIWRHRVLGEHQAADKRVKFYDEYNAVLDNYARFYLETVQEVFKTEDLARGKMRHFGEPVDVSAITGTALFTVEGARDDISPPGQTTAAQILCTGLAPEQKFHYLEELAGHYGIFSGSKWRTRIAPRITAFIRIAAARRGLEFDPADGAIEPELWSPQARI